MSNEKTFGYSAPVTRELVLDPQDFGVIATRLRQHVQDEIERAAEGRTYTITRMTILAAPGIGLPDSPRNLWQITMHVTVVFEEKP